MSAFYRKVGPALHTGRFGRSIRGEDVPSLRAQSLAAYLVSCPHGNPIGLFRLPVGYIMTDRGWTSDGALDALSTLRRTGLIRYDEESETVWVIEAFRHEFGPDPQRDEEDGRKPDSRLPLVRRLVEEARSSPLFAGFCERYLPEYPYLLGGIKPPVPRPVDALRDAPSTPRASQDQDQEIDQDQEREKENAPDGASPSVPKWATNAAKGTHLTGRAVLEEVCHCVEVVHGRAPDPARVKTSADSILKLWRALGRPDDFFEDFRLVAEAAHGCGAQIFARDIRAEGWAEGTDRQFRVATIARQEPWAERIAVAKAWRNRGRPAAHAQPPPGSERLRAPAPVEVEPIDVRARLDALAAMIPNSLDRHAAAILALDGPVLDVEAALGKIDEYILRDLPDVIGPERIAELSADHETALLKLRGRLGADQLAEAASEIWAKLLRAEVGLPELSLFAPEVS